MSLATSPQLQLSYFSPVAGKIILIADEWRNIRLADEIREQIRQSGWDCEIFPGDVSDCAQMGKLVHDVLDCCHRVNLLVNVAGPARDRSIGKVTDEEWLAQ